jgi:restriction endonuclease S subunit
MGLTFTIPLSQISLDGTLRQDADFFKGVEEIKQFFVKNKIPFFKLRDGLIEIRNGEDINESGYSFNPTKYVYLSVTDVREGYLDLTDPIYLNEYSGKELEDSKLTDGDIIITRSGTVGLSHLFKNPDDENIYIPSGYLTMIRVNENLIYPPFAVDYFNSSLIKNFSSTYACGKNTQNISHTSIKKMPFPAISIDKQKEIYEGTKEFDIKIKHIENSIPDTQKVIEAVFCNVFDYIPSAEYFVRRMRTFIKPFSKFDENKHLRLSAKYNFFWEFYKGHIFESKKKYPIVKLKRLMKVHRSKTLKKGFLNEKYILLDKEDVEPKTGIILNEEYVDKIESDKVLFGNCDMLISKIRPYLGHVILNDPNKPYIGTTEFVPYKVDEKQADIKFMQYVFLNNNFLELSYYVMAGKNQPRINPNEVLILNIPLPPKEEQCIAVKRIDNELNGNTEKKQQIRRLKEERDIFLLSSLN